MTSELHKVYKTFIEKRIILHKKSLSFICNELVFLILGAPFRVQSNSISFNDIIISSLNKRYETVLLYQEYA